MGAQEMGGQIELGLALFPILACCCCCLDVPVLVRASPVWPVERWLTHPFRTWQVWHSTAPVGWGHSYGNNTPLQSHGSGGVGCYPCWLAYLRKNTKRNEDVEVRDCKHNISNESRLFLQDYFDSHSSPWSKEDKRNSMANCNKSFCL